MARAHLRSGTKLSGGRLKAIRKKKLYELGSDSMMTKLEARKTLRQRTIGGNHKVRMFSGNVANVYNPSTKKCVQSKIITIKDNTANRNFIRRNIMTKGGIIQTELGLAKITSRPGQEGTINAILIKG